MFAKRILIVAFAICLVLVQPANAQPAPQSVDTFATVVQPFIRAHCVKCHDEREAEGELRLDTLTADFGLTRSAGTWVEVLDRVNLGEMPPEDEPRPDADELARLTDWITSELQRSKRAVDSTGGRVVLRRLSRQEYANTVRDLLHVQFVEGEGPRDLLPPDGSIQGFDRISKALLVDPSLMDAYFDVASRIAKQTVRFRPPPVPEKSVRFDFRDTVGSPMGYLLDARSAYLDGDTMVIMQGGARTFARMRHPFNNKEVPITGRYRVRIQAAAFKGDRDEPIYMNVTQGPSSSIAQFRVDAAPDSPQIYEFETTRDELFQGEYQVAIVNGTNFAPYVGARGELHREATDLFTAGKVFESTRIKTRLRAQGDYDSGVRGAYSKDVLRLDDLPKLYLDWIEVTGPLQEKYPPKSMTSLFFDGWEPEKLTIDYARQIFKRLLPRAYRRRVTDSEVDEVTALAEAELNQGRDFQTAIQTGLVAMLCSPKFLYLYEPTDHEDSPRPLSDFELASRLSYFLWSSKPDDDLLRLAIQEQLSDPTVISAQVDRMIADPRVEGFIQGFVRQWLKIDEFNRFPPDQGIFPRYYATEFAGLEGDLMEQPLAMIRELLAKDEPIDALLESDWTMANERLAAFYEMDTVAGEAFRRVSFAAREDWEQRMVEQSKDKILFSPWYESGPYKGVDAQTVFNERFEPEQEADLAGNLSDSDRWKLRDSWTDGVVHNPWSEGNAAYYLARLIDVPTEQSTTFRFGSDDGIRVWLDDKEIVNHNASRGAAPDQERAQVTLNPGRHVLLMKIVSGGSNGGFFFDTDLVRGSGLTALQVPRRDRTAAQQREIDRLYLDRSPAAIRGGLIGMAGVHMWGSDGNRTKPVERGKYILDVLFNDPPPPPPPNAGEVEPNIRGEKLTVSQRLARHREQVTCNNCHRRIDPYGLALENFNVIGQWRTQLDGEKPIEHWGQDRPQIDISGTLPSGVEYENFLEFKRALATQQKRFVRGLSEKLLMYALARTIEPSDRPMIDQMVASASRQGLTLRVLLKEIAMSDAFRQK